MDPGSILLQIQYALVTQDYTTHSFTMVWTAQFCLLLGVVGPSTSLCIVHDGFTTTSFVCFIAAGSIASTVILGS